jgi:hypothetical protein
LSNQNNQTEYYFGWGMGIGPRSQRLNIAAGAALSPTSQLPAGVQINDVVADASALSNLRTVYRWRFFFALTATVFKTGGNETGAKPPAPDGR